VLQRAGYTVLLADHGEDALSLLDTQADEVALLLTDVIMPHMGGPGLVERVSQAYPHIKVLYMTGYAGDAEHLPGIKGQARLIPKPLSAAELTRIVREVLDAQDPALD
jgi:CheY-like chemotaxis protein